MTKKIVPASKATSSYSETTVQQWLDLSNEQVALIDLKIDLGEALRRLRSARGWSQHEVAQRLKTGQSRIAKAENAENSIGFDFYMKALTVLGLNRNALAEVVAGRSLPAEENPGRIVVRSGAASAKRTLKTAKLKS